MPTTDITAPRQQMVLLEPPDRAQLDLDRSALLADAEASLPAEVASPQEYADIAALEERLGNFINRVEPVFDEHCAAAHGVWKQACKIRSLFLDTPKQLKARARDLLSAFKAREEQTRRDEERRLAEEQHKADLQRQRDEARLLEKQGQPEMAAAVRAQPVEARAVSLPSRVPTIAGLTYREDWYWEPVGGDTPQNRVRSLSLLVKADWLPFLTFNDAALTAFAKRTKGTVRVPGIVFRSRQVAVRR